MSHQNTEGSQTRVDHQDILGVSRIKAGQWPKVDVARVFGNGFLQLQGAQARHFRTWSSAWSGLVLSIPNINIFCLCIMSTGISAWHMH